jgi:hypothetical protein
MRCEGQSKINNDITLRSDPKLSTYKLSDMRGYLITVMVDKFIMY